MEPVQQEEGCGDDPAEQLEVAVLDRRRTGRTFRRLADATLTTLLGHEQVADADLGETDAAPPAPAEAKPAESAASEDTE